MPTEPSKSEIKRLQVKKKKLKDQIKKTCSQESKLHRTESKLQTELKRVIQKLT